MISLRKLALTGILSCSLFLAPAVFAQQPASAGSETATASTWTQEQLLTSTVHQAWLLSGKNEATFFEMVRQLAELSANNRGVTLPDDEAAGRRFGNSIKSMSRADTDQLLYAVVDKAVVMTSKPTIHAAGAKR